MSNIEALNNSQENILSEPHSQTKVYKYRWVIIGIFALIIGMNFMQFLQYTIISNIIVNYYEVETIFVHLTGLMFMITYIIAFVPVSYLMKKVSLKTSLCFGAALTAAGNLIKLGTLDTNKIYLVLVCQALIGLGQIFIVCLVPTIPSAWFGSNQVSLACAIGVFGMQLGMASGAIIPSLFIKSTSKEAIRESLLQMHIYYASISTALLLITLVFFKSKPKLPPSKAQDNLDHLSGENYISAIKKLFKNKDYIKGLFTFGLSLGLWNSFGITINTVYLSYFPDGGTDIGIITLMAIIGGGCIGTMILGLILDKTHKFRLTTMTILCLATIGYGGVALVLELQTRIGSFIVLPLFGFITGPLQMMSWEHTVELTYPISDTFSCSILNAVVNIWTTLISLISNYFFNVFGIFWSLVIFVVLFLISTISSVFISSNTLRMDANREDRETP